MTGFWLDDRIHIVVGKGMCVCVCVCVRAGGLVAHQRRGIFALVNNLVAKQNSPMYHNVCLLFVVYLTTPFR
jgi:hypothetical protein